MVARASRPVGDRFWEKVDRRGPDECWLWQGATVRGYGSLRGAPPEAQTVIAHRFAYEALVGPIAAGLTLDHLCRNRRCVNPEHLEPVTAVENWRRGMSLSAQKARQTECKRGHAFTPENTYVKPSGFRECRACHRKPFRTSGSTSPERAEYKRRWRAMRRAAA